MRDTNYSDEAVDALTHLYQQDLDAFEDLLKGITRTARLGMIRPGPHTFRVWVRGVGIVFVMAVVTGSEMIVQRLSYAPSLAEWAR